ncbi:protein ELYS-like isoform X2 [Lineus longissimus]|uniref:protein ELYS-like isoform X2 n=1 Tax=Lineus longissimus TaxID=88925 RepID=UPI00315CC70D
MKELLPHVTTPVTTFQPASLDALEKAHGDGKVSLGSFSKDGSFSWITRGASLEVVNSSTSERIAAWSFGSVIKDTKTTIMCVVEYEYDGVPHLLVGLDTSNNGMICIFDIKTSKIVKAIEIPEKVTCVEPVTSSEMDLVEEVFSEHLQLYCGLVAVGLMSAKVFLIDLCLDDDMLSDEVRPGQLCSISPRMPNLSLRRDVALRKREHLCLTLDNDGHRGSSYLYRKPDGTVLATFSTANVCVTCIKFVPQMGVLAVGFNFGCFQLWKLTSPVLEYTVSYESDDLAPITHFIYQEPENDPRCFVYLWAVRGPTLVDKKDGDCSALSLYQFGYNRRVHVEHHGILYKDMTSAISRFEHILSVDPYNMSNAALAGSAIISCHVIEDPHGPVVSRPDDDSFEGPTGADLSLCAFIWEAVPEDMLSKSSFYIGLFDMNRWYHSQMPGSVRPTNGSHDVCPFFSFCNMEDILEAAAPDGLLAAHIDAEMVTRYYSSLTPTPEQHFYPSSLGFDVKCLTDNGVVRCSYLGIQQETLSSLNETGPKALADPHEAFEMFVHAGLIPKTFDLGGSSATLPATMQREALLTVCLEHAMIGFIGSCITQWAKGDYSQAGCNLRYMLNWAWKKVTQIKDTLDKLCVPLYDCSGVPLDEQTSTTINKQKTQLKHLMLVFQLLISQAAPTTEQGTRDLQTKLSIVSLLCEHIQVVMWFLVNGLLPEHAEGEDGPINHFSFPATSLAQAFMGRRQELNRLHSDMNFTDLLMIDGLVDNMGSAVKELWDKEGGSGLYPPPSLHALLNLYLLEDVPVISKHCIVVYVIFDLLMYAADNKEDRILGRWIKYAQAFNVPAGMMKLIQGLWLLDHKDFEAAVHMLLSPMVTSHILPWQHTRIIKALLYQAESKLAVRYMKTRQPAMVTPEDVKLKLTVLLANGLISEAYEYQRTVRDQSNTEDLLSHLFVGCQQTKTVDKLLQLSLDGVEERHLVQYLKESTEPNSLELLVMYYLQRARYVEAIRLNEKLKARVMLETDPLAKERAIARNTIVDGYFRILPEVQRKLIFSSDRQLKKLTRKKTVVCPAPLSTVVNRSKKAEMQSQATLLSAILEKVNEVRHQTREEDENVPAPKDGRPDMVDLPGDPGPFICTPVTPRVRSRIRDTSDVVYPTITLPEEVTRPISPTKKMFGLSPSLCLSPARPTDSIKRRASKFISAEMLSLLKTPPVHRQTPMRNVLKPQPTPQSILKVRQVMKRSPSPMKEAPFKAKQVTDMISAGIHMETPPKISRKVMFDKKSASSSKQLRFSIPSSTTVDDRSESPRNVRERSPTPERFSPRVSPQGAAPWERSSLDIEEMDEEVQVIDDEITFNMNKSKNIEHQEPDEDMDTEPLEFPSAGQPLDRSAGDVRRSLEMEISKATIPETTSESAGRIYPDLTDVMDSPRVTQKTIIQSPKSSKKVLEKTIDTPKSSAVKARSPEVDTGDMFQTQQQEQEKVQRTPPQESLQRKFTADNERKSRTPSQKVETSAVESGRKTKTPSRFTKEDLEKFAEPLVIDTHRSAGGDGPAPSPRRSPRLASKGSPVKDPSPRKSELRPSKCRTPAQSLVKESDRGLAQTDVMEAELSEESDKEECKARQMSPLSSGSFMMKLRSTTKGSRETTPVRGQASDHQDEGDEPSFTFAMPLSVEGGSVTSDVKATPQPQSFIFSPPITRSRLRRRQSDDKLYTSMIEPNVGDISMQSIHSLSMTVLDETKVMSPGKPTSVKRSAKKPRKKSTRTSVSESVSDSPINFVSPVPTRSTRSRKPVEPPQGDDTGRSTRRTTRARPKSYKLHCKN